MKLRARVALTLVLASLPLAVAAVLLRADFEQRANAASLADFARARMESGGREQCEFSPATFQEPPLPPRPPPPLDERRWLDERRALDEFDERVGSGADAADAPREDEGTSRPDRDRPFREGPPPPSGARELAREGDERPFPPRRDAFRESRQRLRPSAPGRSGLELFAYASDFRSANPRAPEFPADLRRELERGAREASTSGTRDDRRTTTVGVKMPWSESPAAVVLVQRFEPPMRWGILDDAWALGLFVCALVGILLVSIGPVVRRVRSLESGVRRSAAQRYAEAVPVEGEDELADLARAFNAAGSDVRAQIDVIEKREKSLRDFVENTTHDVMLPLTVLQGHLTRMRNQLADGVTPGRETVRDALEESHYMTSLVQNLGAAAKLETAELRVRHDPFAWNALIERVVLRHKPIASGKGVELDYAVPDEEVVSLGDVTLVEQALSNVVHNAVRYNASGGHVGIVLEARGGRFTVRVLDDGPGVGEAELARLAERSYRGDAARTRYPDGRGLGLSIAKDVAERHGFELAFARAPSGGLEVVMRGERVTRAG